MFTLGDLGTIELVTTSVVFANVFFIRRKALGIDKAKELLRKLRILVGIVPVCEKTIDLALNSKFSDFENGMQYFTAREKDVVVQTPEQYLKTIKRL